MVDDHDQSFTSSSFNIKYSDEYVETSDWITFRLETDLAILQSKTKIHAELLFFDARGRPDLKNNGEAGKKVA